MEGGAKMKWEYKVIEGPKSLWSDPSELIAPLNEAGKEGWELVNAVQIRDSHSYEYRYGAYLKRPIPD